MAIDPFAPFKGSVACDCLDAGCRWKGCKILIERARCLAIARSMGSPDDLKTLGPYEWYGDLCADAIARAIEDGGPAE